jgi:hypothetical protein
LRNAVIDFAANESFWRDDSLDRLWVTVEADHPTPTEAESLGHIGAHSSKADHSKFHERSSWGELIAAHCLS